MNYCRVTVILIKYPTSEHVEYIFMDGMNSWHKSNIHDIPEELYMV